METDLREALSTIYVIPSVSLMLINKKAAFIKDSFTV
jgi:hypothetical protein